MCKCLYYRHTEQSPSYKSCRIYYFSAKIPSLFPDSHHEISQKFWMRTKRIVLNSSDLCMRSNEYIFLSVLSEDFLQYFSTSSLPECVMSLGVSAGICINPHQAQVGLVAETLKDFVLLITASVFPDIELPWWWATGEKSITKALLKFIIIINNLSMKPSLRIAWRRDWKYNIWEINWIKSKHLDIKHLVKRHNCIRKNSQYSERNNFSFCSQILNVCGKNCVHLFPEVLSVKSDTGR